MSFPTNVTCLQVSSQMLNCNGTQYTLGDHLDHTDTTQFYLDIGTVCGLVILAGMNTLLPHTSLSLLVTSTRCTIAARASTHRFIPFTHEHNLYCILISYCRFDVWTHYGFDVYGQVKFENLGQWVWVTMFGKELQLIPTQD